VRFSDQNNSQCGAGAVVCGGCGGGLQCTDGNCSDVDECASGNGGCDAHATCANTVGGRTCTCQSGYSGNGLSCTANRVDAGTQDGGTIDTQWSEVYQGASHVEAMGGTDPDLWAVNVGGQIS